MVDGEARRRRQQAALTGIVVGNAISGRGGKKLLKEWLSALPPEGGIKKSGMSREEYLREFEKIAGMN